MCTVSTSGGLVCVCGWNDEGRWESRLGRAPFAVVVPTMGTSLLIHSCVGEITQLPMQGMSSEPFFVVVLPPLALCAPSLAESSEFGCPGAHRKAL